MDRRDVHPHHLLRAVLADPEVREVLGELGADADEVLLSLDGRWLAAADTIDVEEVEAVGIDLGVVLAAVNPPFDEPPDWGGRHITDATREVLVRGLAVRAGMDGHRVGAAHLLVALMASKDGLVVGALRDHGLSARAARPVVARRTRRR